MTLYSRSVALGAMVFYESFTTQDPSFKMKD